MISKFLSKSLHIQSHIPFSISHLDPATPPPPLSTPLPPPLPPPPPFLEEHVGPAPRWMGRTPPAGNSSLVNWRHAPGSGPPDPREDPAPPGVEGYRPTGSWSTCVVIRATPGTVVGRGYWTSSSVSQSPSVAVYILSQLCATYMRPFSRCSAIGISMEIWT